MAEYSTQIAQTPQVSYLTQDHLGSPRVVTNENGAVTNRKDYSAFGEETISSQRTNGLGYTAIADQLRQGYTGYEKDSESGLDFAQARYYNSMHGRYTSVDPMIASATIKNPQTFNRYSYVLNSPYKFSDPLGLLPESHSSPPAYGCSAEFSSCGDDWGTWEDGPTEDSNTAQAETPATQETEQQNNESQQQAEQTDPPPPPTVIIKRNDERESYTVSGETANDAIAQANKKFQGKFAGDAQGSIRVRPSPFFRASATAPKKGSITITATLSDITIEANTKVTMPTWDGYATASPKEQSVWDNFVKQLGAHEDGHVDINKQEAEKLKAEIESVLPTSNSFSTVAKSTAAGFRQASSALNVPAIQSTINKGLSRYESRNTDYENKSEHRLSPEDLQKKGIIY